MKTKVCVAVLLIAGIVSACNTHIKHSPAAITKDTLAYSMQKLVRAQKCVQKADSTCLKVTISYPQFKTDTALNDTLARKVCGLFAFDKSTPADIKQLPDYFQNFRDESKMDKEVKGRPPVQFELNIKALVLRQDSDLTTLQVDGYTFQGGAHGSSLTRFINWNPKTHKPLTLDDILKNGYWAELNQTGEHIFRHDEKLNETASLARDYFFKDAKFSLSRNYSITPVGIRFVYNENEIKPYAAGKTDLLIPYKQITTLLKPNTVIKQYLK